MKREIKDLKPYEAIEITKENDIFKLNVYIEPCETFITPAYLRKEGKSYCIEFDLPEQVKNIYPASDFIKTNKLKKRVKELEDMVTQLDGRVKQLEAEPRLKYDGRCYSMDLTKIKPIEEPEIDFHLKGQLLIHEEANLVVLTDGTSHLDRKIFGGIVVSGNEVHKKGESSKSWNCNLFKIFKKDITLSNQ